MGFHEDKRKADDGVDRADNELSKLLTQHGWAYSSRHPGSLWLWSKEISGKSYVCDRSTALHIEESLHEDTEEDAEY